MSQPDNNDILTAVKELRVTILEMRADWADRWSRSADRLDELSRRVGTLTDGIADLRAEYNGHSHPDADEAA
jgi:hypothetical protein